MQQKKDKRLEELAAEANELLGEPSPEEARMLARDAAMFEEWHASRTVPTVVRAELTEPPVAVPVAPMQFDPAVLARVASIKAAGRTASPASVCTNLPC